MLDKLLKNKTLRSLLLEKSNDKNKNNKEFALIKN